MYFAEPPCGASRFSVPGEVKGEWVMAKDAKRERWLIAALMLIGVLVRVIALDRFPGGINQDEAYSAYEAWCLLSDGMDSWGYRFPVYLTVWGSGQSALQSYLMAPLMALLGPTLSAVRLPEAINACLSLPIIYLILRRLYDRRTALIGLAFLVVCPWHIMMARWGLDCNFAPGLLLMGMYFFIKGSDEPKAYLASGFVYGLSLYAYATIWVVLPFMLLLHAAYLWYTNKLRISRWLFAGAALLGVMAAPLIAFLAVNWGILPEIQTAFFSIPRMPQMRGDEVTFANLYENVYRLVKTFLLQRDGMIWNATDEFGLYYHISLPFMLLGGCVCLICSVKSIWRREFDGSVLILIWLALGMLQGCMIDGNINRLNFLHMPIILCIVLGIAQLTAWLRGKWRIAGGCIAAAYAVSFVLFIGHYFTGYQQQLDPYFDAGLDEALDYAQSVTDGEITVSSEIIYPKILYYGRIEPETFRKSVVWSGEPGAFMRINTVDRYRFGVTKEAMHEGVCILKAAEIEKGLPEGVQAQIFGSTAVVHRADPE